MPNRHDWPSVTWPFRRLGQGVHLCHRLLTEDFGGVRYTWASVAPKTRPFKAGRKGFNAKPVEGFDKAAVHEHVVGLGTILPAEYALNQAP